MGNEKQRKTFLSYSRANKDFAIKLAKELKAEGFLVWLDQLDIPAGSRWDREVEKALKESEIFMIILTQASVDSENVMDEIGYAIDTRKRFLPVLLEDCDVPLRLRRFQYVDFTTKSFDEGVESAKELLRSLIAQTTIPRVEVPTDDQDQSGQSEREAQVEAGRIAKQKSDDEMVANVKAEIKRREKEESGRLAMQKAEADRIAKKKAEEEQLAKQKVEYEQLAQAKAETERKAKEEADRLAAQKAVLDGNAKKEAERLTKQKAEDERLAKAKAEAERKAKEEADRLAIQKAENEAKTEADSKANAKAKPVEATPSVMNVKTVSVVTVQKKPISKGLILGVAVVVVLIIAGISFNAISKNGGNNNPSIINSTTKAPIVSNLVTEFPTPTKSPVPTASPVPTDPRSMLLSASDAKDLLQSGVDIKGFYSFAKELYSQDQLTEFGNEPIPLTLANNDSLVLGYYSCEKTEEIRDAREQVTSYSFTIDGIVILGTNIASYDYKQDGDLPFCHTVDVVFANWLSGTYIIHQQVEQTEKVEDVDPYTDYIDYILTVP